MAESKNTTNEQAKWEGYFDVRMEHLVKAVSIRELQEEFAAKLKESETKEEWKQFISEMKPGDELWEYCQGKGFGQRGGYCIVSDQKVLSWWECWMS